MVEYRSREVLDFFVQLWAPEVDALHSGRKHVIDEFLNLVVESISDLPTHEV